jgi:hypothetical protein
MDVSEFHDILANHHFGGNIGNGSLCCEISLIAAAGFSYFSF